MAFSGPPWMPGWACRSPSMPSGVIQPSTMARLGSPPGEMLSWAMTPCIEAVTEAPPGDVRASLGCTRRSLMPLNVVIQGELVGMRPQAHGLRLVLAFVIDEGLDQLFGEDIAAHEEGVVVFQATERLIERPGYGGHALHLFGREVVDVLVERFAGVDAVEHSVQSRHQHAGEGQIGVRRRVGRAELDAFGLGAGRVHRYAAGSRTVAPRVRQVDRSFVAGHEPLITIGGRRDDGR